MIDEYLRKKKAIALMALAIFSVVLVIVGYCATNLSIYENTRYGIQMNYPAGWKVVPTTYVAEPSYDSSDANIFWVLFAREVNGQFIYPAMFSPFLQVQKMRDPSLVLKNTIFFANKQTEDLITRQGYKGIVLKEQDDKKKQYTFGFQQGADLVIITCGSDIGDWDGFEKTFMDMVMDARLFGNEVKPAATDKDLFSYVHVDVPQGWKSKPPETKFTKNIQAYKSICYPPDVRWLDYEYPAPAIFLYITDVPADYYGNIEGGNPDDLFTPTRKEQEGWGANNSEVVANHGHAGKSRKYKARGSPDGSVGETWNLKALFKSVYHDRLIEVTIDCRAPAEDFPRYEQMFRDVIARAQVFPPDDGA